MKQRYFTATHRSGAVLRNSSSGGVFTAVTDEWISVYKEKSVIYGCVLDKNLNAKHMRATDFTGRNKMRGSKYISSDVSGVYKQVLTDLKSGFYVVFSGTPCQIAGLKSYLSVSEFEVQDNLLTVEVVCHGVGSNSFFRDYISHLEKKYSSKAVKCSFRAKSRPGKMEDMEVIFANGKKYNASSTRYDWFYSAYIKNYILRPSCFSCKYSTPQRIADICIFDNWKELYSNTGTKHLSAVITNSESGYKWFSLCSKNLEYSEKTFDDIYQSNLSEPTAKPQKYDEFWNEYNQENGYLKAQKFIGNHSLKGHFRSFIVDMLYRLKLTDSVKALKTFLRRFIRR